MITILLGWCKYVRNTLSSPSLESVRAWMDTKILLHRPPSIDSSRTNYFDAAYATTLWGAEEVDTKMDGSYFAQWF